MEPCLGSEGPPLLFQSLHFLSDLCVHLISSPMIPCVSYRCDIWHVMSAGVCLFYGNGTQILFCRVILKACWNTPCYTPNDISWPFLCLLLPSGRRTTRKDGLRHPTLEYLANSFLCCWLKIFFFLKLSHKVRCVLFKDVGLVQYSWAWMDACVAGLRKLQRCPMSNIKPHTVYMQTKYSQRGKFFCVHPLHFNQRLIFSLGLNISAGWEKELVLRRCESIIQLYGVRKGGWGCWEEGEEQEAAPRCVLRVRSDGIKAAPLSLISPTLHNLLQCFSLITHPSCVSYVFEFREIFPYIMF